MRMIKNVTLGRMGGKPIEYTSQEKPRVAVKCHVPTVAPAGFSYWADNIVVDGEVQVTNRGKHPKGYSNNSYKAKGTFDLNVLQHKNDGLRPPKKTSFTIQFEDHDDNFGMPDFKVTEFTMT